VLLALELELGGGGGQLDLQLVLLVVKFGHPVLQTLVADILRGGGGTNLSHSCAMYFLSYSFSRLVAKRSKPLGFWSGTCEFSIPRGV